MFFQTAFTRCFGRFQVKAFLVCSFRWAGARQKNKKEKNNPGQIPKVHETVCEHPQSDELLAQGIHVRLCQTREFFLLNFLWSTTFARFIQLRNLLEINSSSLYTQRKIILCIKPGVRPSERPFHLLSFWSIQPFCYFDNNRTWSVFVLTRCFFSPHGVCMSLSLSLSPGVCAYVWCVSSILVGFHFSVTSYIPLMKWLLC